MRNHRVAHGRFFTESEMADKSSVIVLGAESAAQLFPLDWPVGQTVRVGGTYYRVIGVMESRTSRRGKAAGPRPSLLLRCGCA